MKDNLNVKSKTCFGEHKRLKLKCLKKDCRMWLNSCESLNCCLIESEKGSKTLEEVGSIFGITRMRVCQIEKKIINKIKKFENIFSYF